MSKITVQKPFFVFNPKSYLFGDDLLELALEADRLAANVAATIFMTAPYAELARLSYETEHIVVTAQHLDGIEPGRGMGHVLPESLVAAGAKATFLNHAEHPMTLAELVAAIKRADELEIVTIVCADSLAEAATIATLKPDILLCEPTELIGTGQTSEASYILETTETIKNVDSDILVMQAAGINDEKDVYRTIDLGADGTGCTSGIVKANNPKAMLKKMIQSMMEASEK